MSISNPGQSSSAGTVHARGSINNPNYSETNSATYVDSLLTVTLTLTKTCTVYAMASGGCYSVGGVGGHDYIEMNIGGTSCKETIWGGLAQNYTKPWSIEGAKAGCTAGNVTAKVRMKTDAQTLHLSGANDTLEPVLITGLEAWAVIE